MKPHLFKGSGPGFLCLHRYGSEDTARFCHKTVDDPIHVALDPPPKKPLDSVLKSFVLPETISVRGQEEQLWPGSARAVWRAHSDMVADLLKTKEAYGDAWVAQGYMGNIGRILSKNSRLKNMMWRDETGSGYVPEGDESVLDTLKDLSALCAFAIANIEEGNRWGR